MPGIPRTRGCNVCKARKIKCDENWPSCTPCQRSNRDCPGPTPLVNLSYISPQQSAQETAASGSKRLPIRAGHRSTTAHAPKTKSKAKVKPSPPSNHPRQARTSHPGTRPLAASGCQQALCPSVLRPYPTTRPSQLASYLSTVLNDGTYQGDLAQLNMLSFIPQRLHLSECLFDSVAFWCHLQLDTRRNLPKPSVATLHYYSKALQSLQSTLEGKDAYRTETLAAAVLLQRTTPPFHKAVKSDSTAHAKGISALVVQRGRPILEDDLDISLANELGSMLFCWHSHEPGDTCHSDPEPVSTNHEEPESDEDSFSFPERGIIRNTFIDLLDCIPILNSIHANPESKETMTLEAADTRRKLYDLNTVITDITSQIKSRLFKQGLIKIIPDPDFFVQQRYHLHSVEVAQLLLGIFILEIIAPKMLYDLIALYDSPDQDDIWKKYRDGSVQLWMCIPYLATLDLTAAQIISCAFSLTFEAADATEKDHVLNVAADYDTYLARLRNNRTLLTERVLRTAKQLTGRAEIMPIQVWMSSLNKTPSRPSNKQTGGPSKKSGSDHLLHGCLFFEGLLAPDGDTT